MKTKFLHQNFVPNAQIARQRKLGWTRSEFIGKKVYDFLSAGVSPGGMTRYYMLRVGK